MLQHVTCDIRFDVTVCAYAGAGLVQAVKAKRAALSQAPPGPAKSYSHLPATASPALRFNLNKVAWWLDLESEDSILSNAMHSLSVHDKPLAVLPAVYLPLADHSLQNPVSRNVQIQHDMSPGTRVSLAEQGMQSDSSREVQGEIHKSAVGHTPGAKQCLQNSGVSQESPVCFAHVLPTASTELFLQLEASSQQCPEPASYSDNSQINMLSTQCSSSHAPSSQGYKIPHASMPQNSSTLPYTGNHAVSFQQSQVQPGKDARLNPVSSDSSIAKHAKQGEASSAKHAKQDAELCPKAAEAPFVREGSYAEAAQKAKARSVRQQQQLQQLQQLTAQQQQAKAEAAGSKQSAAQVTAHALNLCSAC